MPDVLAPPTEAASDPAVFLLWGLGVVLAGFGLLWYRFTKVSAEKDGLYSERIASGEAMATLLAEVRAAMVEGRKSDEAMKAALYELRDEVRSHRS